MIIADRRITDLIPKEKLERLESDLESCYRTKQPWNAILVELKKAGNWFAEYVPRSGDDINELPDDLWIS